MTKNDAELIKQDYDSRQVNQSQPVHKRAEELAARFAPGKAVGWQIDEEISLQN